MDQAEVFKATAALRKAVKQQRAALEFKPWKVGAPTHDALGNALCFMDAGASLGERYWIALSMGHGAHIRALQCGNRFQVFANCEADAKTMAETYAVSRRMESIAVEQVSSRDGWAVVEYRGLRRVLD